MSSYYSSFLPTFTWTFQLGSYFLKSSLIATKSISLLFSNFSHWGNSPKVLPLQPIAAHGCVAIFVRAISPKILPLQPTHSYMEILIMGNSSKVIPLHSHGNISQEGNFTKVLPLQPIAAPSNMAVLVRGVFPQKWSHCSPLLATLTWQF